jgi:hypothetical protein
LRADPDGTAGRRAVEVLAWLSYGREVAASCQAKATNGATVEPGGTFGTRTIQGSYTQTAVGTLLTEIGGASQYGELVVTDNATLGRTLDVSLFDGYMPALRTSFTILTLNQRSGDFATENGLKIGRHRSFVPSYQNGALVLAFKRS